MHAVRCIYNAHVHKTLCMIHAWTHDLRIDYTEHMVIQTHEYQKQAYVSITSAHEYEYKESLRMMHILSARTTIYPHIYT